MKIRKQYYHLYLLLSLLGSINWPLHAQTYLLNGNIKDSTTQQLILGVHILAIPSDSTLEKKGTLSDEEGNFILHLGPGNYKIQLSQLGYQTLNLAIHIDNARSLGTLLMQETISEEVTIERQRLGRLQRGDTAIYKAASYKIRPNATTEELLRKIPGFEADESLKVDGQEVTEVLVDGVPFKLGNPKEALNSLPADMVQDIEVYQYQSEHDRARKNDVMTQQKTLNVITKKKFRLSLFGDIEGSGGSNLKQLPLYYTTFKLNNFNKKERWGIESYVKNIWNTDITRSSQQPLPQQQVNSYYNNRWNRWSLNLSHNSGQYQTRAENIITRIYDLGQEQLEYYIDSSKTFNRTLVHTAQVQLRFQGKRQQLSIQSTGQLNTGLRESENRIIWKEEGMLPSSNNFQAEDEKLEMLKTSGGLTYSYKFNVTA